jgi:hypothetical protein
MPRRSESRYYSQMGHWSKVSFDNFCGNVRSQYQSSCGLSPARYFDISSFLILEVTVENDDPFENDVSMKQQPWIHFRQPAYAALRFFRASLEATILRNPGQSFDYAAHQYVWIAVYFITIMEMKHVCELTDVVVCSIVLYIPAGRDTALNVVLCVPGYCC